MTEFNDGSNESPEESPRDQQHEHSHTTAKDKKPVADTPPPVPVTEGQRVLSVDVLRGFALLGILVMNINFFGWPSISMFNPSTAGGFEGLDLFAYQLETMLFSQKFMTIFSMLFGAGLILMVERWEKSGRNVRRVYFRRVLWLIVFGLMHAYFIWEGDVLFFYGCCGLWLYLFRNVAAKWLVTVGAIIVLVGIPMFMLMGAGMGFLRSQATAAQQKLDNGETLNAREQEFLKSWGEASRQFNMPADLLDEKVETYRSGYPTILAERAPQVIQMHTFGFLFMIGWRVLGLMLMGMGLMKLGFFAAEKSYRTYGLTAIIGYAVGLPITYVGMNALIAAQFDPVYAFSEGLHYDYVSSVLVSLGHMSVVMMICKAGLLKPVQRGLAAVGRSALSNYLLHSVVMTTLFYGYGFGLFGSISRFHLLWLVVAMWAVNISVSLLWFRSFRFGPAEWLWRTLTYGRAPAMRRTEPTEAIPAQTAS